MNSESENIIELNKIRSRPRFKVYTDLSKEEFMERLSHRFQKHQDLFYGFVGKERTVIGSRKSRSKFWTPFLQLRIEEDDESQKTVIRGLFGPRANIWTFYMFLYSIGFTLLLLEFIILLSSLVVHVDAVWFIPLPVALLLIMGTYATSLLGQYWAKHEMKKLRKFIEYVLRKEKILNEETK